MWLLKGWSWGGGWTLACHMQGLLVHGKNFHLSYGERNERPLEDRGQGSELISFSTLENLLPVVLEQRLWGVLETEQDLDIEQCPHPCVAFACSSIFQLLSVMVITLCTSQHRGTLAIPFWGTSLCQTLCEMLSCTKHKWYTWRLHTSNTWWPLRYGDCAKVFVILVGILTRWRKQFRSYFRGEKIPDSRVGPSGGLCHSTTPGQRQLPAWLILTSGSLPSNKCLANISLALTYLILCCINLWAFELDFFWGILMIPLRKIAACLHLWRQKCLHKRCCLGPLRPKITMRHWVLHCCLLVLLFTWLQEKTL